MKRKKVVAVAPVESVPAKPKPSRAGYLPRDEITGKPLNPQAPGSKAKRKEPLSLADAAQRTFRRLGGANWLKRNAIANPKEFIALLARTAGDSDAPAGAGYVAFVVPVEQRETATGALEPLSALPGADPLA